MNLDQLKRHLQRDKFMDSIYTRIRHAAEVREKVVYFNQTADDFNKSGFNLNTEQVNELKEDGYTVTWNQDQSRYEVSGWIEVNPQAQVEWPT